jgi:cGMP-dependent protein kinase
MTGEQKDSITRVMFTQLFDSKQNIVTEGDQASSFYIIKEGVCAVIKDGQEVRRLGKGDSFGEQALYFNTTRAMTVQAVDPVRILALGRDTVQKIFGDQIQLIVFRNIEKWAIEKDVLLKGLNKVQIEKVCESLQHVTHKAGDVIIAEKSELAKIIIPLEFDLVTVTSSTGGM